MAKATKTFPTLTKAERELFDLHLSAITTVERPNLVALLMGGLNSLPVVETPGKIGNAAWRNLHADECQPYNDESSRQRQGGGSQVETVRAFIKRIALAYREAFDKDFPVDAVKLTDGGENTVDIWRVR